MEEYLKKGDSLKYGPKKKKNLDIICKFHKI